MMPQNLEIKKTVRFLVGFFNPILALASYVRRHVSICFDDRNPHRPKVQPLVMFSIFFLGTPT